MVLLISFLSGAVGGLIAGLFGGGIGVVLVPALLWVFTYLHVASDITMHMAIGTAVASIIVFGSISSYSHNRRKAVDWYLVKNMSLTLCIGIILGAVLADFLPSELLVLLFGIVVLLLAIYVWFGKNETKKSIKPSKRLLAVFAFIFGFWGSILGINSFCVPFFKKLGLDIRIAVGTTSVIGVILALGICIMFIITGWDAPSLPKYSTGYVDWALVLPVMLGGMIFTPLGAKLAHFIPRKILVRLYSILLVLVSIKMIVASSLL